MKPISNHQASSSVKSVVRYICCLQDLVDTDIFLDAKKVIQSLRNKDCSEALAWCAENRSKLKKAKVQALASIF